MIVSPMGLLIPCGDGIDDVRFTAFLAPPGAKADAVNRVATEMSSRMGE